MSLGNDEVSAARPDPEVPETDKRKMAAAGVLLLIPIVALMWVPLYARETPKLFDFPFFIWYQFAWVFICSAMTWTAFKLTLSARAPRQTDQKDDR
jgi:membrane protein implicated in regulation of membrane protease activity